MDIHLQQPTANNSIERQIFEGLLIAPGSNTSRNEIHLYGEHLLNDDQKALVNKTIDYLLTNKTAEGTISIIANGCKLLKKARDQFAKEVEI